MAAAPRWTRALLLLVGLGACQPGRAAPDTASCEASGCGRAPNRPASAPTSLRSGTVTRAAFDYWVLALSWSPEFCASHESDRGSAQCSTPHEFVVHGLWPQYEHGYPAFCATRERVSEATAERLRPIVPDRGLVFHRWKKHGSCSGFDAEHYFATLEEARASVQVPSRYLQSASNRRTSRSLLEKAFLDANPGLPREALAIDCRGHYLEEVRVCLDRELKPRACGTDMASVCGRELIVRPVQR